MNWYIHIFSDYHEINSTPVMKKAMELGCWPVKNGSHCDMYFGLFYNDKRPKRDKVFQMLKQMIEFDEKSYTDEELDQLWNNHSYEPMTLKRLKRELPKW